MIEKSLLEEQFMKINYKETLQYQEDNKRLKIFIGICVGFFLLIFILSLGGFFYLKNDSFEIALTFLILVPSIYFLIVNVPWIIMTIIFKRQMNSMEKHMDETIYVFTTEIKEVASQWGFSSRYIIVFDYKNVQKIKRTTWFFNSSRLENSYCEVGYIESLNLIVVIKKLDS